MPRVYHDIHKNQGPVSITEKTSYRKISWSLEAARFVFRIGRSLLNMTGTSAALLPMCLSDFKAMRQFKVPMSWLRDFTRSCDKTSLRILRRGPEDNIGHPSKTHLKPKSPEISMAHSSYFICLIVLEFCTQRGSDTAVFCTKLHHD